MPKTKTSFRTTHGMTKTRVYKAWLGMRARCGNPRQTAYSYYGGRGIKVCERWSVFENFLADMGEPGVGLTLDRIDSNGNYEPSNCRWATKAEQTRNQRKSVRLTMNGKTLTQTEWAREVGIHSKTISMRLRAGFSDEEALTAPKSPGRRTDLAARAKLERT